MSFSAFEAVTIRSERNRFQADSPRYAVHAQRLIFRRFHVHHRAMIPGKEDGQAIAGGPGVLRWRR